MNKLCSQETRCRRLGSSGLGHVRAGEGAARRCICEFGRLWWMAWPEGRAGRAEIYRLCHQRLLAHFLWPGPAAAVTPCAAFLLFTFSGSNFECGRTREGKGGRVRSHATAPALASFSVARKLLNKRRLCGSRGQKFFSLSFWTSNTHVHNFSLFSSSWASIRTGCGVLLTAISVDLQFNYRKGAKRISRPF